MRSTIFIVITIIIFINFYQIVNINGYYKNKLDQFHANTRYNIGNEMSEYFYKIGECILNKKDFTCDKYTYDLFFKDLRTNIPYDELKPIHDKFKTGRNGKDIITIDFLNSIASNTIWTIDSTTVEYFWICMKPLCNTIYKDAFRKSNLIKKIDETVIHFRCSDIPFYRHLSYHFQKYKFFKDALINIGTPNKSVLIVYSNLHTLIKKNKLYCDAYVESLKNYLIQNGYTVKIHSESQLDDFATIFHAPSVISTCGSFSFMSGYFSDGKFVSSTHYFEGSDRKCNGCEWMYKGYDVDHKDIADYYDYDQVIKQLNSNEQFTHI